MQTPHDQRKTMDGSMSGESFRFIHAGDFHLETPLGDFDVIPSAIRSDAISAPRTSALAVFDAALAENIDFLVLSGDLLSPSSAGPHGMSLIINGLERLAAKDKPVFWTTGTTDDCAKWPDAIPLPPNVHLFSKTEVEMIPVQRGGRTICTVIGRSSDGRHSLTPSSYAIEPTDHFSVAVGCGHVDRNALSATAFDHWCLGGKTAHQTFELSAPHSAAYCGSPQSRQLSQPGPHGYLVVDVDADRTRRMHQVPCDVVRYFDQSIDAAAIGTAGSLKNLLSAAIVRLQSESGGRHLVVRFNVNVQNGDDIALIGNVSPVLESLRRDHGGGSPVAWTTSIDIKAPQAFPKSWQDEDTILGDFLRAVDAVRESSHRVAMESLTEETAVPENLANRLASPTEDCLDDAVLLGVRMLRGEKI